MDHGLFASRMGHGLEWKGLKLLERHWKTLQLLRKLVNFSCRNNFLRADGEKAIFHVKTKLVLTFVCSLDFFTYCYLMNRSLLTNIGIFKPWRQPVSCGEYSMGFAITHWCWASELIFSLFFLNPFPLALIYLSFFCALRWR